MKGKHLPGTALFFSNVTCTAAYDTELTKYYKKFARERQPLTPVMASMWTEYLYGCFRQRLEEEELLPIGRRVILEQIV